MSSKTLRGETHNIITAGWGGESQKITRMVGNTARRPSSMTRSKSSTEMDFSCPLSRPGAFFFLFGRPREENQFIVHFLESLLTGVTRTSC